MNRLYDDDDDVDGRDAGRKGEKKKEAEAKEEPFEKQKDTLLCCEMRGVKWMMMVCSTRKKLLTVRTCNFVYLYPPCRCVGQQLAAINYAIK